MRLVLLCPNRTPPPIRDTPVPAATAATAAAAHAAKASAQAQVTPLTLKAVGEALLDVQVPWKPNDWLPPGGMLAL